MTLLSKSLLVVGLALVARASTRAMQQESPSVPAVVLDLLAAFAVSLAGALLGAGPFRPIHLAQDASLRCKDISSSRPDFAVFSHRGPLLRSRQF
ncbi:hypothetical protein NGA_0369602 [Nannochloropsis gaditana CCMP526]|uniref:uncharacterized protein n=1 Tax=Nannochloropsis gaditana (strain CCMP526) TaxID=1093141 RepID=UPI00029F5478|nr:hypothetical protein NGA_0369602 [Nannochloropsis gaditana CCMP526]EKU23257.1 hypothetical protein NGA_0369602 [Nannochloropsis gaditana CCMP526]|eukprot:XP_005852572.1 hypothetical protein NGA_0369602 [Nannochloropsis gaditana CCMP526]